MIKRNPPGRIDLLQRVSTIKRGHRRRDAFARGFDVATRGDERARGVVTHRSGQRVIRHRRPFHRPGRDGSQVAATGDLRERNHRACKVKLRSTFVDTHTRRINLNP